MLYSTYTSLPFEAGIDEAGRGCLAGPVVAAAVILPLNYTHPLLNDSKKLSKIQREAIREDIKRDAVSWAIGEASPEEIDEINILQATYLAMHRAVEALANVPAHLIVDGNRFKQYKEVPHTCIIKGDAKYLSIAAASVLAKTYRDDKMAALAAEFADYGWEQNAGYPTIKHREAILKEGVSPHHRKSFRLLPEQLPLF
ncbi:ribonuclease HII [Pontibacter sp. SGAir0037]|uniref:ribonuclease HII n=1 Tax=Pontibacter sp. SGAir0037 TaxID=2571030 RepID=UPI0010CD6796|nr:ribonuclease HII [Pontibacter sp. SGAir0037]QCR23336.1 ribonuclease HII [Pontibacter sp. SGAir0037]